MVSSHEIIVVLWCQRTRKNGFVLRGDPDGYIPSSEQVFPGLGVRHASPHFGVLEDGRFG